MSGPKKGLEPEGKTRSNARTNPAWCVGAEHTPSRPAVARLIVLPREPRAAVFGPVFKSLAAALAPAPAALASSLAAATKAFATTLAAALASTLAALAAALAAAKGAALAAALAATLAPMLHTVVLERVRGGTPPALVVVAQLLGLGARLAPDPRDAATRTIRPTRPSAAPSPCRNLRCGMRCQSGAAFAFSPLPASPVAKFLERPLLQHGEDKRLLAVLAHTVHVAHALRAKHVRERPSGTVSRADTRARCIPRAFEYACERAPLVASKVCALPGRRIMNATGS
jgi:hypothetical protein